MEKIYEFYGDNLQGRFKLGQEITKEMLESETGVVAIEKFIERKVLEPIEDAKEGEPKFKETTEKVWVPGFVRISKINIIYEIIA